jgi:hypothetical protein
VGARWLRAALTGDDEERRRIARDESVDGPPLELSVAACGILAARLFDERWDRRLISTFAERVVARVPSAPALVSRHIEAVLRGLTWETELLVTADYDDAPDIILAPLFALADELGLDDDAVDALLVHAEKEALKVVALVPPPEPGDDPPPKHHWKRTYERFLTADDFPPRGHDAARPPRPFPAERYPVRRWRRRPEPASVAGRYLRSRLLRQFGRGPQSSEVPDDDAFKMVREAFTVAVKMYLHPEPELAETLALASAARATFWSELDLLKAEYLTRWTLGEKMPFTGINRGDLYPSALFMLGAIMDAWNNDDAAVCAVLVEAEGVVEAKGHTLMR